uniref:Uncharacterized protein n=1 Tax=Chromera velia CCMP2878 TaxID=1169474 RepID=A0A0G4FYK7_9ALVE|mmetsp:Transcript_18078/g.36682  ORF Transcript_18078/g.36682 Transcript_18078/m.36682 type:complete len:370 (+) Transcript_18078:179-1288(+)|eukprot:Cvel_3871.t1-p1 / transcript=Cvel_3871.t1 / gene=Cvel_3871 / organism=Chromera_velia_CCMP2878 / gene_product=Uncharacterized oxidoreductase C736.13, putative / transcript_product=Uncharacterized oxidoreductase C736.13, putative / location=Cvel_scaffold164:16603-17709(-) / protein_length=369 / sequence_SO=supercontig / SO=protein_coding / is_pseudo=false
MGVFGSKPYDKEAVEKNMKDEVFEEFVERLPDLSGKVVAITGCTTGLGLWAAIAAAKKGAARVLMLNRKSTRSEDAETKVKERAGVGVAVETVELDLMSPASVKACAERLTELLKGKGGLNVLANNAGIMAMKDVRTESGYEVQMQTNQLCHALLTSLLMPLLEEAAEKNGESRVVMHSSSARDIPSGNLKLEYFRPCEPGTLGGDNNSMVWEAATGAGGPWQRYHQTKLANVCFALALSRKLKERGSKVKVAAADPGVAVTELQVTSPGFKSLPNWLASSIMAQTAADGSTPLLACCFLPDVESGDFFLPKEKRKGWPVRSINAGVAVKSGGEKNALLAGNLEVAWKGSEEFVSKFSGRGEEREGGFF